MGLLRYFQSLAMTVKSMKIVIFAGGVGTRLWPLSRKNTPKQFERIIGDKSTLQQAVYRLIPDFSLSDIYVVTGKKYEDVVTKQLRDLPIENFIFEPTMRDVGPAIGLASLILLESVGDSPMAIVWSDHLVKNEEVFRKTLRLAENLVEKKKSNFVFIAQRARFANQNIGWIEIKESKPVVGGSNIYSFKKLIYRPKFREAKKFFEEKKYVWNLGYFVTRPSFLLSLFKKFKPEMYKEFIALQSAWGNRKFGEVLNKIYPSLEKISFDDAILQKIKPDKKISVISDDLGWSDVGAWEALKEALAEGREDNVTSGKVMLEDTKDSLVFNYTNKLCVAIDINGMLVIDTDDVLLICQKKSVPKIKKIVEGFAGTPHEHLT